MGRIYELRWAKVPCERPRSFRKSKFLMQTRGYFALFIWRKNFGSYHQYQYDAKKFVVTDEENRFAGRSIRDYMITTCWHLVMCISMIKWNTPRERKGKTRGLNAIAYLMKPKYASLPQVINYRGPLCIPCTILMFGDFHVRVAYKHGPRSCYRFNY